MRKPAITIALVAALALGGCTAEHGAAAVVDGTPIPVSTVDRATRELNQVFMVDPRGIVTLLVVAPSYFAEARALGVAVSHDEARDYVAQVASDSGADVDPGEMSEAALDILSLALSEQRMAQLPEGPAAFARIHAEIAELDIEVSPRFGEFSPESLAVVPTTPDWILPATS